jgi:hypothetical protein
MIPHQYSQLAQMIHQERIQAAQQQRPEWDYSLPPVSRFKSGPTRLRLVLAKILHQPALFVEPNNSTQTQPPASIQPPSPIT